MRFFGTDGIRGVANKSPMTPFHIVKVGVALTNYFRKTKSHKPKILIGKDTRLSGYMLETSLSAGITAMGGEVFLVGPMPTPGIAFLTKNIRVEDALGRYIVFLKSTLPRDFSLEGFKIILDCANGATYKVAPMIFSELRARVKSIGTSPDGTNINRNCGSLYPENLSKIVLRENADIGLAFDGDGDRLIPVDEKGKVVSGDEIIAIVADFLKERNELNNNFVVGTVMSNYGLRKFLDKKGIKYSLTPVGDRFVLEEMLRKGAILGGENSGHIIFLTHHTTGDGLLTALQLLSIMKLTGKKLSQLRKIMKVYPQVLLNIPVKKKIDFSKIPAISAAITRSEKKLSGRGRVLIRYSGTQMLLRIMVEGPLRKEISKIANDIKKTFQRHGRLS